MNELLKGNFELLFEDGELWGPPQAPDTIRKLK
jgi:hypothetical protein